MQKINVLQAGRALAALAVVAYHAGSSVGAFTSPLPAPLSAVLRPGYLGVDFFFVLSGFIIYHTAASHASVPGLKKYAFQRSIRIFVPYWPIGLSLAAIYLLMPEFGRSDRGWSLIESATLLPFGHGTALAVAWTLEHEVMFYVIFGIGLLLNRPLAVIGAWMGAIVISMSLGFWPARPSLGWHDVLLSPTNLEFGMGVAAALWYRSGRAITLTSAAICIALPVALWAWLDVPDYPSLLVGLDFAILMAWATCRERDIGITVPPALVFLGSASYAIYLIHVPVLSLTSRLAETWPQALVGGIAASLIAGAAYHVALERPLLKMASPRKQAYRTSRRVRAI